MDIPVLHSYRRLEGIRHQETNEFEDAEKVLWDDLDWQENWNGEASNKLWSKAVLRFVDMQKQKIKFNNAEDLKRWMRSA